MDPLHRFFTEKLMMWFDTADELRNLPWKYERNPYKVWLSEIMLQQTQANNVVPYYEKFLEAFPTINDLASEPEDDIYRMWQGLGYYNRCKNMIKTAVYVTKELKGQFPKTKSELAQLPGIGDYTSSAIASFAFGEHTAVVDGNVYRVLARFFGIEMPIDSNDGKKYFKDLAQKLIIKHNPGQYNQAIMDFGATVCKPKKPLCFDCPLESQCFASRNNVVNLLPIKEKKVNVKDRFFHFFIIEHNGKIWMNKRTDKDVWQNLFTPFLIEKNQDTSVLKEYSFLKDDQVVIKKSNQRLTHQKIYGFFYEIDLENFIDQNLLNHGAFYSIKELKKLPLPKLIDDFLRKNKYL